MKAASRHTNGLGRNRGAAEGNSGLRGGHGGSLRIGLTSLRRIQLARGKWKDDVVVALLLACEQK